MPSKTLPRWMCWDSDKELPEEGDDYAASNLMRAAEKHAKYLDQEYGRESPRVICVMDRQKREIVSVTVNSSERFVTDYTLKRVDWDE